MTDYPQEVREEAARRANAESLHNDATAGNITNGPHGRALCRAVADGLLHPELVDPVAEVVASLGLTNPDELAAADVAIRAWIEREAGQ